MAANVGQTFLERPPPPGCRFSVRLLPLPRCPPPLADELLSSWLKRLARANYCTEDELCRYLGLRSGRAPETLADLAGVDVAGLCSILRLVRDDLVAMLIVEHHNFPIRCVAQEDFQHCPHCITQTPGATLRHWRYAWSVTCENCGSELTPSKTGNGQVKLIPTKLKVRAARGAEFLKSTFANRSARDARRVNFAVQIAGSLNPNVSTATLTAYCQMQRFNLLAAIGMSASQPVLKAAFVLRNDAPTIENLRRAFPYQRRLLKIVIKLSDDLNRKIPRREKSEHLTAKPRDAATTYLVSKHSLTAARQAIEEPGPNAPRHKLLSYAATILEKQ